MKKYTLAKFAEDVLKNVKRPLTYQDIWKKGLQLDFEKKFSVQLKDPENALGAQLYRETRVEDGSSIFIRYGNAPVKFFLRDLDEPVSIDSGSEELNRNNNDYKERDIHPLLTYFVYSSPSFNRGRCVFTKTILHEKSKKDRLSQWVHPDMVGVYIPLEEWHKDIFDSTFADKFQTVMQ